MSRPTNKILIALSLLVGFSSLAQPANDNFANRIVIRAASKTVSGTLSNATSEVGEPLLNGISSGQTAWWSWTAPADGLMTIEPGGTNFTPLLTIFAGDELASLSLVASNNYLACYSDGDCGCHWRMRDEVAFHVFRGNTYQLCLDAPIVTDASMEWTNNPAIVEGAPGFLPGIAVNPDGTLVLPPLYGVVFTTNVIPGDEVTLKLHFTSAPFNDDFARAALITGSRAKVLVSNCGATKEPGEPDHDGNPGGSSVWYSWKAPASGRVILSTNEFAAYAPPAWQGYSDYGVDDFEMDTEFSYILPDCGQLVDQNPPPIFYPLLAAYTGTKVSSLASANYLPLGLDAYPYAVEFDAVEGHTYHIACDGNMGTTNRFDLWLALTLPAVNDVFARRIALEGTYLGASGYNAGAMPQPGAPDIGNGSTGKLAWWSWTAPVDGTVSIDLSSSDYSFPVGVFTGTKLSSLNLIASGAGGLSFAANVGQKYQIAVGDAAGLTGEIKMVIQAPVVAEPLLSVKKDGVGGLLQYGAVRGQVLQLQTTNATSWKNLQKAIAHSTNVNFYVKPAPQTNSAAYRAIVVDYIAQ